MSQPTRGAQPPAAAAALPIIERLIATVDAENRDLEQGRRVKYEIYSLNKNQGGRTAARCAGGASRQA
jgi:hypothetical protein